MQRIEEIQKWSIRGSEVCSSTTLMGRREFERRPSLLARNCVGIWGASPRPLQFWYIRLWIYVDNRIRNNIISSNKLDPINREA